MPVVFVSNQHPNRDYEPLERKYPLTFVTIGSELNVEFIVRSLTPSKPDDFLVLDGSALIASACLLVWIEMHGECNILRYDSHNWINNRISRTSLRRVIAQETQNAKR